MKINWMRLIFSIGICLGAGLAGSAYTTQSVSWWYPMLNKPSLTPPAWLFGPVWSLLFILMGISVYLIWNKGLKKRIVSDGVALFTIQLILNVVWSYLFFGLRNPLLAFFEIVVLWVMILVTLLTFIKIERTAGLLLIPYLLWVSFAGYLNLSIALLN